MLLWNRRRFQAPRSTRRSRAAATRSTQASTWEGQPFIQAKSFPVPAGTTPRMCLSRSRDCRTSWMVPSPPQTRTASKALPCSATREAASPARVVRTISKGSAWARKAASSAAGVPARPPRQAAGCTTTKHRIPLSRVDPGPFPSVSWPIVRPRDETKTPAAAAPATTLHFRHALLLLGLGSGCALAFEVALTRVCSAVLQYHVSFAVVSLAVLGLGLGGFLASLVTRRQATREAVTLTVALLLVSPGILLTLVVLLRLPFAAHWTTLLFLMLPPFIAVGSLQALLLR